MADPRVYLATAAIGLFVGLFPGCQGSLAPTGSPDAGSGPGSGPGPGPADSLDIDGRWAMFLFEDPVAVDVTAAGGVINGKGCCGGFQEASALIQCCGAVSGQIADRRASFGFAFDFGGEAYSYWTDAFVSADARRMTGTFSRGGLPVTWLRVGANNAWLPRPEPQGVEIPTEDDYGLTLVDDPPAGNDFQAHRIYQLKTSREFVYGDLGAFWTGEMGTWGPNQTLVIGPVSETVSTLPVKLSLRFDDNQTALLAVEATMPSGIAYHFQPTTSQP
jgi:hypothetical protein